MFAAFLALTASLLWGSADFVGGFESRRSTVWAVALFSQLTALVVALVVLAITSPRAPTTAELVAPIIAGVAITLNALGEYKSMTLAPMSLVAPIFAGAAVVSVVWGLARGERPGVVQFAGMAMTIVGIVLITRPERRGSEKTERASRAGILLAVFAVLGWLSPAVTVFWAQALLHERLRPLQWFAAALVLAGVVCLALG